MSDPLERATVSGNSRKPRKVYEFAGMSLSADAEARMRDWEQRNRLEKHGKASYSAAAFGTTDDSIRSAFAEYIERFGRYL